MAPNYKKKLYSLLMEQRSKAKTPKDIAWEFKLTKKEKEQIIGPIEDPDGTEQNYIYAIYPWEHRVYALTMDGWDIELKSALSEATLEKLYTSMITRLNIK